MEYSQIPTKFVDFQKMSFDSLYSAVSLVQDQVASTMDMMINRAPWIPEDGRTMMQRWMDIYKDERNRFKSYVDISFSALEKTLQEVREPMEKAEQKNQSGNETQG